MRTNVSKAYRALLTISAKSLDLLVDLIGIEPMTSSMPYSNETQLIETSWNRPLSAPLITQKNAP